jgi:phosphate transport system protein
MAVHRHVAFPAFPCARLNKEEGSMRAVLEQELIELQARLVELGKLVQTQLDHDLAALATGDPDTIQGVVGGDQQINQLSAEIDWGLLRTLARQAPVASDLRLVAGLLHVNEHLERMGDLCVNLARAIPDLVARPLPAEIQAALTQMGTAVRQVVHAALDCLADADSAAAERLPALDATVDQLNDHIFGQLEQITDPAAVARATRLVLVARFLERIGDQAVDIAEQVCFIATGEVRELQPPKAARTLTSPR